MPFTLRSIRLLLVLTNTVCILVLYLPTLVQAETKTIVSEATYSMGDGETPSFAEAMVLQKAKQRALEEAGTYVESYTKVRNLDLTAEEIQTIAGGVLQVEVLEKKRSTVGEGFQFFIKIKTLVTTDKMEELARRIKGKDVAEEYRRLQGDYARLSKELEALKQALPKLSAVADRDTMLDQLREREKSFRTLQAREANLFERLTSGETLFSKAMAQISQKETERSVVDTLFAKILDEGYTIALGEPQIHASVQNRNTVRINVPVTIKVNEAIRVALEETARMLGGPVVKSVEYRLWDGKSSIRGLTLRMGNDPETLKRFQHRVTNQYLFVQARSQETVFSACYLAPWVSMGPSLPDHFSTRRMHPFGINPVSYFDSKYGFGKLGPSQFSRASERATLNEDGFVMIADSPGIGFTLGMTMSIEQAKQMTSVVAKIVDVLPPLDEHIRRSESIPECTLVK